jgi:2,4-dienoyl-CoA reductase (NADPH2)
MLAHCRQIELTGVDLKLNTRVSAEELLSKDSTHSFDQVVLATGVLPRQVSFPGSDHPKVVTYVDVLRRNVSERYTT